ncbi:MAG: hypothetical protein ACRERC_07580 [Candidatus Binatia bacterium]
MSHFATWLKERVAQSTHRRFDPGTWDRKTRRVSVEAYVENLRSIISTAQARGTRVILLAPPVNLFQPPSGVPALPNAAQVMPWCEAMLSRIGSGDVNGALAEIDTRLAADPGAFYARWLRGLALTRLGDRAGSEKEIERAFQEDPFADRAPLAYREAIGKLAASEGVPFVDSNALLRGPADAPFDGAFADHCHPNAIGHDRLAKAIAPIVLRAATLLRP